MIQKTSEPRHGEDYSLPFEMPSYADDPFPVGAIAPAQPTIAVSSSSSPFGSPRIAAEAVDTLPLARGAGQSQQQQHGAAGVRVIALHERKPARNWQAELRPGLVLVIDARLGSLDVGLTTTTADSGLAEEWWIGRKFGDESGPRRAVSAGLVHILHGDARLLRQQSLSDLLRQEGIDADREVVLPIAAPAQQDARQVLPRPAAAVPAASESGEEQKRKNEAAEALKRESERDAEREKAQEEQEKKAREAAEELLKRQAEEEEVRRKRQAESERKAAAQEKAPNSMPPADHKDSADKSRTAITAGAYNMMPVPVMSGEIEAAIKERG